MGMINHIGSVLCIIHSFFMTKLSHLKSVGELCFSALLNPVGHFFKSQRKVRRPLENGEKIVLTQRGWRFLCSQVEISAYMSGAHSKDWYIPQEIHSRSLLLRPELGSHMLVL